MGCDVYTAVINIKAVINPSCPSHFSLSVSTFPLLWSPRSPARQARERPGAESPAGLRRPLVEPLLAPSIPNSAVWTGERAHMQRRSLPWLGYSSSLPSAEGFNPPTPLCPRRPLVQLGAVRCNSLCAYCFSRLRTL